METSFIADSVAACHLRPLGFEHESQAPGSVTVAKNNGGFGLAVGAYPLLDYTANWARQTLPPLEQCYMTVPPDIRTKSDQPMDKEPQSYSCLTDCAFPAPNEAMKRMGVDAACSESGHLGERMGKLRNKLHICIPHIACQKMSADQIFNRILYHRQIFFLPPG